MRAILQRVSEARVEVNAQVVGAIGSGLLVFLGVTHTDTVEEVKWLVRKITNLRIFNDEDGKMNRSLLDVGGSLLVVSQFTLYADTRKGLRPSFDDAAKPEYARKLYDCFVEDARQSNLNIQTGVFQASMQVHIVNDGPVTLICDSP